MNGKFDELAKALALWLTQRQPTQPASRWSVQILPGLAWGEHPDRSASGGREMSSVASDERSFSSLAGNLQERQIVQIWWHFVRPGVSNDDRILVFQFRQKGFAALWRDGKVRPPSTSLYSASMRSS